MSVTNPVPDSTTVKKKRWPFILAIFLVVVTGGGLIFYFNFNKILAEALKQSFENNIISDVYELKFEKLYVNFLDGDIRVSNVVLQPRANPLQRYPYINSSFKLSTGKLILRNVKIRQLLETQTLSLDKIVINKPEVELSLAGDVHVFLPFQDSTDVAIQKDKKKSLQSFFLQKFELNEANFNATNSFDQRKFAVKNVNFAFNELFLNQRYGIDFMTCKSVELSIESFDGQLLKSPLKHVNFQNFLFNAENLELQKTIDTVIYKFDDFITSLDELEVQTADSILHVSMKKFGLSYKNKSIKLQDIAFKPNITEAEMQKRFKYQNTQFSATVRSIDIIDIEFDSLMYHNKLFIKEVIVDSVSAAVFKDKTKRIDPERFPLYPGQQVASIKMPVQILKVTVKNSAIVNRERKPDGNYAKVTVNNLQATATNITNLSVEEPLVLSGSALLENVAHFNVNLKFDYTKPQFSIDANIQKFNLKSLNNLLRSYSPASVHSGVVDEITLNGMAYKTYASGQLKFLYHDLNIDLKLDEQAEWKNIVGAFAANTYLQSSNPTSPEQPERVVKYDAERDMHKGFINIVLKSVLSGLKETMIMSKENRKAFQEVKKKERNKNKKEK